MEQQLSREEFEKKIKKDLIPSLLLQSLAKACTNIGEYFDPFIEDGTIEGVDFTYKDIDRTLTVYVYYEDGTSINFNISNIESSSEK